MNIETKANVIGGATLLIVCSVGFYFLRQPPKPVGSVSVPAVEAPAVKKAPRVKMAIKAPVATLQGDAKRNLKLPEAVRANAAEQVVAASQVKSDLRPQTVSTTINTETGEVKSYVKTDPYPWFAVETRGEIKAAYGYKYRAAVGTTAQVGRLQLSYDVIRVKALTVGGMATADTDGDAFAGVAISYKF